MRAEGLDGGKFVVHQIAGNIVSLLKWQATFFSPYLEFSISRFCKGGEHLEITYTVVWT